MIENMLKQYRDIVAQHMDGGRSLTPLIKMEALYPVFNGLILETISLIETSQCQTRVEAEIILREQDKKWREFAKLADSAINLDMLSDPLILKYTGIESCLSRLV